MMMMMSDAFPCLILNPITLFVVVVVVGIFVLVDKLLLPRKF